MKTADGIVRVGGVGTGRIFQHAHLTPYPRLWPKAWLVGFFDQNPARASEACDKYRELLEAYAAAHPESAAAVQDNLSELRCHDSLASLLEQVNVVDVCTHSRGRMATAQEALTAGVHAMVEKPMARTWIEADRAARAFAARPDIFCQLNDDNVFDPRYRIMHDLLAANSIGKAQSMWLIRGSALNSTSVLKSQASALENGGGCLMDYGSHGLAAAWYVLGTQLRPTKVEAVKIRVRFPDRVLEGDPYRVRVDDDAHIKVLMEDPSSGAWATIFLEATWTGGEIGLGPSKNGGQSAGYVRIEGDEGVINTADSPRITITRWDGGETVVPHLEFPGETISFKHEIEEFIDSVRSGTPPTCDVHFGAEVIAICGAAYLSALEQRSVTLEEFKAWSRRYVAEYGDTEQAEEAVLATLLAPYGDKP